MAAQTNMTIVPDKAFYRPGETITLTITAQGGSKIVLTITHLQDTVATLETLPGVDGIATMTWTPPTESGQAYGIDGQLIDATGSVIANASTAVDVLDRWIQAPRYGFLSEFIPDRDNAHATIDALLPYHVNGLQFYDWGYRHDTYMPPTPIFTDPLDRPLSLPVVESLIEAAHRRGIAAMPYTAIYGASPAFAAAHPDWGLFDVNGDQFDFANGFLKIMDPSPGSPWSDHLLSEFADILARTAFDGIHLDQYGAPKIGQNAAGERIDLAEAFPQFIDAMAAVVDERRGEDGVSIFNAVGNWPVETIAPADQDVVYIEVWEPYTRFMDLHRIVTHAEALGGGKPVIIAAYIHPQETHNVLLANALIFASGGVHLELGEPDAMLADPYFPEFGLMDNTMQDAIRRYYDFLVRYEEWLSINTTDSTVDRATALTIDGIRTQAIRSKDRVAVITRQGEGIEIFSLVNLLGIDGDRWDQRLHVGPTPQENLRVRIDVNAPVQQVYAASPDGSNPTLQHLQFDTDHDDTGEFITLTVPALDYWTMIVVATNAETTA